MRRILHVGAVVALIAALAACAPKHSESLDPSFASYISAYTGGVLSEGTAVRVELASPVPMEKQSGDLFGFKPKLAGSERWLSPTVVEFVPEAMKEGVVYEGSFLVGKVLDVKESQCQAFPFSIQVAPKTAALSLDGITIQNEARLQGTIRLSVPAPKEDISLTVDPATAVTITGDGDTYRFETAGIARGGQDTQVRITLKVNGFRDAEPLKTVVPAAGAFKVIDARNVPGGNSRVEITFSEPLSVSAGQEGLITLGNVIRQTIDIKDNRATLYYEKGSDKELTLTVNPSVRSAGGDALGKVFQTSFPAADPFPAVQIPLDGNILPDETGLILPFRAVNLSAVDIRIIKIYENNVLLFLQENDLGGNSELRRAGRLVYSRQVPLGGDATRDLHEWNDFSIDLSGMFKQEPGAIYRVILSFRQEYSLYGGKPAPQMLPVASGAPSEEDNAVWDIQNSYWWDNYVDWNNYSWEDRDNPEKPTFYMQSERFPVVNLLSSNLGLLAQYSGGDTLWAAATDLGSAKPSSGVELEVYDFQLQRIASAKTGGDGLAEIKVPRKPFVLLARKGKTVGYLRLSDGYEKSLSRFDVGGQTVQKGLKGFIYGERGVWRPGDTLHVTMILSDRMQRIPEGHPAALELYTPEGQFYTRMVSTGVDGFYTFPIATSPEDPTGWWNAYVKVGGSAFHKSLHIETIKPNRLKVNLDLSGSILAGGSRTSAKVVSSWLTGIPASGLKASATMTLSKGPSSFPGFDGYVFRNPASTFEVSEHRLFETVLSGEGEAEAAFDLPSAKDAPGLLQAFIVTSVLENGGDESFTTQTVPYSPFPAYVGVKFPSDGDLETDKDHTVRVAVVNASGERLSGRQLEYSVFKLEWGWWWESDPSSLQSYVSGRSAKPVASGKLTSGAQDATFTLHASEEEWGRYLVIVRDIAGGHVTGSTVVIDWPSYAGRAGRRDPDAVTMLTFSSDKESYRAGEKATVYIPAAEKGQALVSLENGSGVISREWVSTDGDKDTPYSFTIKPEMAPNFYVHITLVQPYRLSEGDLPLRLYGVKRLGVEDPGSHLEPVVKVADTVAPEETFSVQVSEKSGKPMTYTLAIVDEGLLDLTNFKTPSPWDAMYRTEALGVKTWDLYDQVVGAFSGRFSPMLSVGGDQENVVAARKDNRFNPVVQFLGPFTLKNGSSMKHDIRLPMYVGSLRVMVVAGHDGAYGKADRTVAVKSPLMVLMSLPSRVCTGDEVVLPVNVFALDEKVKEAKVTVKAEGALSVDGTSVATARFDQAGDQVVHFALKAAGEGPAKVTVTAEGASRKASETIDIQVMQPNPETVKVRQEKIAAGRSVSFEADGNSTLELAGFPAVDAAGLFRTMNNYPYSCTEQISSRGLTLLHLLPQLSDADAAQAREIIPDLIRQLYARQRSDGGFAYWTGAGRSDSWASSMAGQFLAEAASAGFEVQPDVIGNWKRFQGSLSQAYRFAGDAAFSQLDECYRLYTMAVAGAPDAAAMNRLKETGSLDSRAEWMLAAAYAVSGRTKQAKELMTREVSGDYGAADFTYGSTLRDKAVVLQALALTDDLGQALPAALGVAESINKGNYSTQEAAFAAMAMDRLYAKVGSQGVKAEVNGEAVTSAKSVYGRAVSGKVEVKNTGDDMLYATLTTVSRTPAGTKVSAAANGLRVSVSYQDSDGNAMDAASIPQGKEFTAVVKVTNTTQADYRSLALSESIPSGWEILNDRMRGGGADTGATYRDIRDDRCDWFFDLPHGASKTFSLRLRAAYEGRYTLPAITCSAMYNPQVSANTESGTTSVIR